MKSRSRHHPNNSTPVNVNALNVSSRLSRPGAVIVIGFLSTIVAGAVLLSLPISQQGERIGFLDSLFTAASAVTVTGLVVVDTSTMWSLFGLGVLTVLIQVGGLGILTTAGFFGMALNRRLGIRSWLLAGTEIGVVELGTLRSFMVPIFRFVFGAEAVVALLLTSRFVIESNISPGQAVGLGIFHAISAFNNAGFSTFAGGMEYWVEDWVVNLVVAGAFIVGGLGFPVVFEVWGQRSKPALWSLHTKVTLVVSGSLLLGGTIMVGVLEWTNPATLGELGWSHRILASFFQSATARTAGFNTVPIESLRSSTWMIMILLMVIGASSASTGGGIKTSTFAVVARAALAELRGDQTTTLFSRRVSLAQQRLALTLVVMALVMVGTGTFLLTVVDSQIPFGQLLFEAASAFGTVGISDGATERLSHLGRIIVMLLMFVGRVGPVTFGTAVLMRSQTLRYQYPTEGLIIG